MNIFYGFRGDTVVYDNNILYNMMHIWCVLWCAGVIKGDEGIAYVNSYDINDYLPDVKRSVGFCPQKNMLFADLSVMEHLLLFGWVSVMYILM